MGFGIGTNKGASEAGTIKGKQIPVACECWFDSKGKVIPRLIKYKDISDEVITIRNISILSAELKHYVGVPSMEYRCEIDYDNRKVSIRLYYFIEECRWVLCC